MGGQGAGKGFASRSLGGKGLYKRGGAELLGLSSLRSLKWKGFFYHLKLLMVLLHGGQLNYILASIYPTIPPLPKNMLEAGQPVPRESQFF